MHESLTARAEMHRKYRKNKRQSAGGRKGGTGGTRQLVGTGLLR